MKKKIKLIILFVLLMAIPYPVWFGINYYAAGLVDQTQLIEFGMEDDFLYCNDWRPELLDVDKMIRGYRRPYMKIDEMVMKVNPTIIRPSRGSTFMRRRRITTIKRRTMFPPATISDWAAKYGYNKISDIINTKY